MLVGFVGYSVMSSHNNPKKSVTSSDWLLHILHPLLNDGLVILP
jgi:hypothetical protein